MGDVCTMQIHIKRSNPLDCYIAKSHFLCDVKKLCYFRCILTRNLHEILEKQTKKKPFEYIFWSLLWSCMTNPNVIINYLFQHLYSLLFMLEVSIVRTCVTHIYLQLVSVYLLLYTQIHDTFIFDFYDKLLFSVSRVSCIKRVALKHKGSQLVFLLLFFGKR